MALSRALILVAVTATIFSTVAMAAEFIVGDDNGWSINVDFKSWAANKIFRLGDRLVFSYQPGEDNVVRVNASYFLTCSVPPKAQVFSSGHDVVTLETTGPVFFISTSSIRCKLGQRVTFFVLPPLDDDDEREDVPESPSPALAPWSDEPEPSPETLGETSSGFSPFARTVPRKLFRLFQ